MTTARHEISQALATFALAQPPAFSKHYADRLVETLGEVLRLVNAEIEVAADQIMLAGWTFDQLMLVRYAVDPALVELAVVRRVG